MPVSDLKQPSPPRSKKQLGLRLQRGFIFREILEDCSIKRKDRSSRHAVESTKGRKLLLLDLYVKDPDTFPLRYRFQRFSVKELP